jgi:hypothetical protein
VAVWLDRGGSGARTHALVIGLSAYDHLPKEQGEPDPPDRTLFGLAQLESGAASALHVARWLADEYRHPDAPLATVRLHMAPSQRELDEVDGMKAAAAKAGRAAKGAVEKALTSWFRDCAKDPGNVAILYIAGHGIELSKDEGGIVLLADFDGKSPRILDKAMDTGNVRRAMAGKTMARTQFYFVDACRVRPEEVLGVKLTAGIQMDEPGADPPTSSPIFFGASSGTLALGRRGKGTLFSEALVECLELLALTPDDQGGWRVTDTSLVARLGARVSDLATAVGLDQRTTTGGQFQGATLHRPAKPPSVSVRIDVDPAGARGCAFASVGPTQADLIVKDHPLEPPGEVVVPAGLYLVQVDIRPPTQPFKNGFAPCAAFPPAPAPVTVPVG